LQALIITLAFKARTLLLGEAASRKLSGAIRREDPSALPVQVKSTATFTPPTVPGITPTLDDSSQQGVRATIAVGL
jgi:hypothetical protein